VDLDAALAGAGRQQRLDPFGGQAVEQTGHKALVEPADQGGVPLGQRVERAVVQADGHAFGGRLESQPGQGVGNRSLAVDP
jgi:hypothetical protein